MSRLLYSCMPKLIYIDCLQVSFLSRALRPADVDSSLFIILASLCSIAACAVRFVLLMRTPHTPVHHQVETNQMKRVTSCHCRGICFIPYYLSNKQFYSIIDDCRFAGK